MYKLDDVLAYNRSFVENKEYEAFVTDKFPEKKMVILTCMDTRLVELLPKALNLRNGDAKIIKSAGAICSHPFGSVMRSILVAIYELNAEDVYVIGHYDCGMTGLNSERMLEKAVNRGIPETVIDTLTHAGINLNQWLTGFEHVKEAVTKSVNTVRNHPLLPKDVTVHGLIIDPKTGKLDLVVNGYDALKATD
ncbi:carbonic anhydrase [Paenibacillus aurantius]|uniref:carbonic anhydrase n=1 Tax=Paenibacillus aurantius TaxID=2918900 RepID=A0AA96L8W1_9BACL|nr:carbonic anhydrase [Paenibacillus aurantius]WNQ09186.1 carbonic anhydrase [Paenibacillus aurantius]